MEGPATGKFKMKGHTLPGINQRSEGDTDLPDGRSKSSALQHKPWAEEHKEKVAHSGTKEAHVQSTPPKPKPNKDKNKVNDSEVYSTPE